LFFTGQLLPTLLCAIPIGESAAPSGMITEYHMRQLRAVAGAGAQRRSEQAAWEIRRLQEKNTQLRQQVQAEARRAANHEAIRELHRQFEHLQRELAESRDELDAASLLAPARRIRGFAAGPVQAHRLRACRMQRPRLQFAMMAVLSVCCATVSAYICAGTHAPCLRLGHGEFLTNFIPKSGECHPEISKNTYRQMKKKSAQ
jgi:hypothetical protein